MGFYTLYRRKTKAGTVFYYRVNMPDGTRSVGHSTRQKTKIAAHTYCQQLIREGRLWAGSESTFKAYAANNHWFEKGRCQYIADRLAGGTKEKPGMADSTIKRYALDLNEYLLPYLGDMKLQKIQPEHIRQCRVWMREEKGLSQKSINNAMSVLKIMLTWALDNHIIFYDPFRGIRPLKIDDNKRDAFTMEEAREILSKPWKSPLAWFINLVAATTGARLGEIRAFRQSTISADYLDIVDQFQKSLVPVKTKEKRKITLSTTLWALLWVLPKRTFLFSDPGETVPWGTRKITKPLDDHIPKSGKLGRGLCFHSWRKFFNTWLLTENVTGEKIRAVMGHSSGAGMTEKVYASWRPEIYPEIYRAQEKLVALLLENNPMVERFIMGLPAYHHPRPYP